jgi:hypothetical protein
MAAGGARGKEAGRGRAAGTRPPRAGGRRGLDGSGGWEDGDQRRQRTAGPAPRPGPLSPPRLYNRCPPSASTSTPSPHPPGPPATVPESPPPAPSPPGPTATFQKRLRARPTEAGKMAEARFKCRRRSRRRRAGGGASRGGATAPRPTTRPARARTYARAHAQPVIRRLPLPTCAWIAEGGVVGHVGRAEGGGVGEPSGSAHAR